jgi:hypothetical protein
MSSPGPAQAALAGAGVLLIIAGIYFLVFRQDMAWIWPLWLGVFAVVIAVYDNLSRKPCEDRDAV